MSEALLFAEHGENMLCTKIVLNARNNFCTQHALPRFEHGIFMYWTCNSMNNLSPYCGFIVDAKIRASDKDLPVHSVKYFYLKTSAIVSVHKCTVAKKNSYLEVKQWDVWAASMMLDTLNPNWYEEGYFYQLVLFGLDFVSWIFV